MDANVLMTEFILLQLFIFDDKQTNEDLKKLSVSEVKIGNQNGVNYLFDFLF